MTIQFKKVAILGVGLLGGSLGLNILQKKMAKEVVGFGRQAANLKLAKKKGLITHIAKTPEEAILGADLILLAAPVKSIAIYLKQIAALASKGTLVMDVGSTKSYIVKQAAELTKKKIVFVGAHPMAGLEKSGAAAAVETLYEGSRCLICFLPQTPAAIKKKVTIFWKQMGSQVIEVSAVKHDRLLGFTSHLPQMVSYALMSVVGDFVTGGDIKKFSGNGFKDMTRLAGSPGSMWLDICETNRENLILALNELRSKIDWMSHLLKANKWRELGDFFNQVSVQKVKVSK